MNTRLDKQRVRDTYSFMCMEARTRAVAAGECLSEGMCGRWSGWYGSRLRGGLRRRNNGAVVVQYVMLFMTLLPHHTMHLSSKCRHEFSACSSRHTQSAAALLSVRVRWLVVLVHRPGIMYSIVQRTCKQHTGIRVTIHLVQPSGSMPTAITHYTPALFLPGQLRTAGKHKTHLNALPSACIRCLASAQTTLCHFCPHFL